jgi:hypothetical protein
VSRSFRPTALAAYVLALACLLLAAACGGTSSPGVANVSSSTTTVTTATTQNGLAGYARCMRGHDVPGFPNPVTGEGIPKGALIAAAEGNPQVFAAAQAACGPIPNGSFAPQQTAQQTRTRIADWLSFAGCMRSHGVERFPDPDAQGHLSVAMVEAQGIDIHSPAVLHAVATCLPASHGLLTAAKAAEAIREAGG